MDSIAELTSNINAFCDARDWRQFHNPKDMAVSINIEAAEILEHFQWKNAAECEAHIEANREAAESWSLHMDELASSTLLPLADSWYMGANIPGKPRQLLHHSGAQSYLGFCSECRKNNYFGFDISQ